ncbi:MAG: hypothetical protein K2J57_00935, partial [Bacteroidales bacterium]|nr:hypothetical protein [Bacteroidales bacterium]
IYRLYLHHYPTYEVVYRDSVERDSLPYIYGKDTIRQFGLTELHRYQTVHGCDSITYVQLEEFYRERHFYDTLQSCGPASFQWRGVKLVVYRTGDYTDSVSTPNVFYHLHVAISYPYSITYTDSCYIEELPYAVAGRPIASYGTHTVNLVSEPGCDSVCKYVLTRRWHWYNVRVKVRGEGSVNVTDTVLREDASLWLSFSASSCYKLNSLTVNGKAVPLQGRYELKDLHGDCTVEVDFASLASAETRVEKRVCVDSLPIIHNGEAYGAGEHTIVLRNAAGCDSVIRLQVQGKENAARIAVLDTIAPPCGVSEIAFSYTIEAGAPKHLRLMYDATAKSAGFRDTVLAVGATGTQTVRITLPPSVHSDHYGLRLWQADGTGCYVAEDALTFE